MQMEGIQKNIYKAPEVIVVVGNSIRRFYTTAFLQHVLNNTGHNVVALSLDLDMDERDTTEVYGKYFQEYSPRTFKATYSSMEQPRDHKSYILLELHYEKLMELDLKKHNIKTMIFTDLRVENAEMAKEIKEYIDHQYHHSRVLDRIFYNTDAVPKDLFSNQYHFLQVDELKIPRQWSFGETALAEFGFSVETKGNIICRHDSTSFQCSVAEEILLSTVKKDGLFGALAYVMEEDISWELITETISHLPTLPYMEEYKDEELYLWTRPVLMGDAVWDGVKQQHTLCIGASIYLYNETLIEKSIDDIKHILVVAEHPVEAEFYAEYFLEKEQQSMHKVVFYPSLQHLPHILRGLFKSEKIMYMFEYLPTFKSVQISI